LSMKKGGEGNVDDDICKNFLVPIFFDPNKET